MNKNNEISMWPLILFVFVVGAFLSALINNNTTPSTTSTFAPDTNSFEHRYVKERVKLEGYSDREASQAADAIIKFHNAQKTRGQ